MNRSLDFRLSSLKYIYKIIYLYYFLLALLMVTPFYGILNFASIGLAALCILNLNKLPSKQSSVFIFFYAIQLAILLVNLLFIEHQESAFYGLVALAKNVITAILPALFIVDFDKLRRVLLSFVCGGVINVIINIVTGVSALSTGVRNLSEDVMLSINSFSHASLVYFLCAYLLFYFYSEKKAKFLILLILSLILLSLIISGSRQSFASIVAFFCFIKIFGAQKGGIKNILKTILFIIVFICVVIVVIEYFPNAPIVRRFMEGENTGDEDRLLFYSLAWKLFLQSPLVGYGIDTFKYFTRFVYTHSTFSELIFTGGFFYTLFFFLYYIVSFVIGIKLKRRLTQMKYSSIVAALLGINFALLVNGLFFLVHASRLALSLQFVIVNLIFVIYKISSAHSK